MLLKDKNRTNKDKKAIKSEVNPESGGATKIWFKSKLKWKMRMWGRWNWLKMRDDERRKALITDREREKAEWGKKSRRQKERTIRVSEVGVRWWNGKQTNTRAKVGQLHNVLDWTVPNDLNILFHFLFLPVSNFSEGVILMKNKVKSYILGHNQYVFNNVQLLFPYHSLSCTFQSHSSGSH